MNRGRRARVSSADLPSEKGVQMKVIRRVWQYLKRYPVSMIVVIVTVLITSAFNLALPMVLKIVIDEYIQPVLNFNGVLLIFIALIISSIVISITTWILHFIMSVLSSRVSRDIREEAFARLQNLPIKYYDDHAHGDILSIITNDVETINNALSQGVPQLLSSVISLIGSLILMFYTNWALTLVNFAIVPIVVFLMYFITSRSFKYFRGFQEKLGEVNAITEEDIKGLKAVKLYNQEAAMKEKFAKANEELRDAGFKSQVYAGFTFPIVGLANNLLYGLLISIGAYMHILNPTFISVGDIQAMTNYSKMFTRPISNLAQIFNILQAAVAGGHRVFTLIDQESEYSYDGTDEVEKVTGRVEFKDVCFSYIKGTPVLNDINFVAEPGQTIAIVGPTGSGKTTIINLLNRFYDIGRGDILIDDKSIYEFKKDDLRKLVGIVLQTTYLFEGSILENIRYGKADASFEDVVAAAKLAQVHDIIERLPNKYDTIVKRGGSNFSHGEQQLISIARTILADPEILVLDEATSSVDTRTESNIQKSISSVIRGRTSFVIAHRLQTIRQADVILVLDGGRIIERGNHEELLAHGGMYYDMYTTQFGKIDI